MTSRDAPGAPRAEHRRRGTPEVAWSALPTFLPPPPSAADVEDEGTAGPPRPPFAADDPVRTGSDEADPLRPVWLLDVDGVLNATKPGWGAAPLTRTVYADAVAFHMRFAPALLRRLRELHHAGAVEVRWATTWVDHIDQITGLMGLPSWQCAFTLAGTGRDAAAAKYAAAMDVVQTERRRLIWTDDEAIPADGTHAHRRLTAAGPSVLLIRPAANRGLRPEHLDRIEAFLRS